MSSLARNHLAIGDRFQAFAAQMARCLGSPWSFVTAVLAVAVWMITGPLFHFSNAWQLVINTATTIITFLMVFLIQSSRTAACTSPDRTDPPARALLSSNFSGT